MLKFEERVNKLRKLHPEKTVDKAECAHIEAQKKQGSSEYEDRVSALEIDDLCGQLGKYGQWG